MSTYLQRTGSEKFRTISTSSPRGETTAGVDVCQVHGG